MKGDLHFWQAWTSSSFRHCEGASKSEFFLMNDDRLRGGSVVDPLGVVVDAEKMGAFPELCDRGFVDEG